MNLDTRGWISIGLFLLTVMLFGMIYSKPDLDKDQVFALLAQAVIISGLIGGPISYLFGSSKKDAPQPNSTIQTSTTTVIPPVPQSPPELPPT